MGATTCLAFAGRTELRGTIPAGGPTGGHKRRSPGPARVRRNVQPIAHIRRSCGYLATARTVVLQSEHNGFHRFGFVVAVVELGLFLSVVRFGEFTMSIFAYRKHLRFLSPVQRRRWWDQKKRLTPRVRISGAYVPPNVTREFTYVKVG